MHQDEASADFKIEISISAQDKHAPESWCHVVAENNTENSTV